jgi:hypothetical protein
MRRPGAINGSVVDSTSRLVGRRYGVTLSYATGESDAFDWEVFEPGELAALGAAAGLLPIMVCADFNEGTPARANRQSFQAVLERREVP